MEESTSVRSLLCEARCYTQMHRHREAHRCYLSALTHSPALQKDESIVGELTECFSLTCDEVDSLEEAEQLYAESKRVAASIPSIHKHMAALYFRLEDMLKASQCYGEALKLDPTDPSVLENIDNTNCQLVDRWHFQMLNDTRRNSAFEKAIKRSPSATRTSILDIGSGTCLLSMMAAGAGYQEVYACDESEALHDIAQDILMTNELADKVTLLHSNSADLNPGLSSMSPNEIPKVDVIVTETVDAGLFSEHILSTLSHAWRNLLKPGQHSLVIPGAAEIICCLIESHDIVLHHRYTQPTFANVCLEGIEIVDYTSQPLSKLPSADMFDPYTTYDLRSLRGGYKKLSESKSCMTVDFNSLECIEHLLAGHEEHVEVKVLQAGRVDAVAVWFNLHVDDEVTISSDPEGEPSCWHPAIFPVSMVTNVSLGDVVHLQSTTSNSCLQVFLEKVIHPCQETVDKQDSHGTDQVWVKPEVLPVLDSPDHQTTHPSVKAELISKSSTRILANSVCHCRYRPPGVSTSSTVLSDCRFYLESQEVYRLNDSKYNSSLLSALQQLMTQRGSSSFSVLDMSPMFSTLPLQACKLGAEAAYWLGADNYRKSLYDILSHKNHITNAYTVPDVDFMEGISLDCIICDLVEPSGMLRQRVLNDLAYLKLASLRANGGVIIPGRLVIKGQCIRSLALLTCNQVVDDSRTCGWKVSSQFNKFRAMTQRDIDLSTLNFQPCSGPFTLLTMDLNSDLVDSKGLPEFLNHERLLERKDMELDNRSSQTVTALVYWFELAWDGGVISTLDSGSHWRQAAVVLPRESAANRIKNVKTRVKDGILGISVSLDS